MEVSVNRDNANPNIQKELTLKYRNNLRLFVRLYDYLKRKYTTGVFLLQQLIELNLFKEESAFFEKEEWTLADLRVFANSLIKVFALDYSGKLATIFNNIR